MITYLFFNMKDGFVTYQALEFKGAAVIPARLGRGGVRGIRVVEALVSKKVTVGFERSRAILEEARQKVFFVPRLVFLGRATNPSHDVISLSSKIVNCFEDSE